MTDIIDAEVIEAPKTRKDRARRLLLEAAVLKQLSAANAAARAEIAAEYEPKDADVASFDGTVLGRVRMDEGRVSCFVSDAAAALAWVEVNHPEQIDEDTLVTVSPAGLSWIAQNRPQWLRENTVRREVYPAYLSSLVARVKAAKGGKGKWDGETWTDPETGEERSDLPGWITWKQGDPILNVTPSEESADLARELLAGRLPELEA